MDDLLVDVKNAKGCKRKNEVQSNGSGAAAATSRRNVLAKNPNKTFMTIRKSSKKTQKTCYNNEQEGTMTGDAATMKKSSTLKELFKGCFVRRSMHKESSNVSYHHKNETVVLDHDGMVAAGAASSTRSAGILPVTISISTRDPHTLHSTLSSSSLASSSPPAHLCLNDFAPSPLQQSNRVNFAEFIFSIPQQALDTSARLSLDECGSNLLHLACFHGTNHDTIRYIFDKCRHDTQQYLLTTTDQDGNLPSHILVSSICRQKIDLDDGLKTLKLFYEICPETIFELNSNEELVTDIAYGFQRYIHEDSSEFSRLDTLYSFLRDMMSQVWLRRKLQWEEMGHEQIDFDAIMSKISSAEIVSTTSAMKSGSLVDNLS